MSTAIQLPALPALVVGQVSHTRKVPLHHAFTHRSYQWLVDLDDLPRLPRWLRPLAGFRAADHLAGGTSGAGIRGDLSHFLSGHGIGLHPTDRVLMLANARVFGHVFNPLTVFWVLRADGSVRSVAFEVHNTYGSRHTYVIEPDQHGRAATDKTFYVSPFNDVSGSYAIRLRLDADQITVAIGLDRGGDRVLTATTRGVPEPATRGALLRVSLTHAFMTHRVSALIRFHGIRLWLRRLPIVARPTPSKEVMS